mmetsp:Transcript_17104/g.23600  ORF Transcript_17104/g.23600 Transcript_17104/m.23600 type:complete len:127 (+) Transcript_17104:216-596(+)|eukprot:CAMPEP_0196570642 /NCGR_PEP_ID=MMETSP1081-20130531/786_1 /TAXON_ID=36882 /ORGANISM="Pyramimonas amylifera, Strain CCMP720" /LENGTH=126 /DNA_ID=CAMNT_0041887195 /DNA_START=225 /DNA_END=605 /DNA_ORIENTATION=+
MLSSLDKPKTGKSEKPDKLAQQKEVERLNKEAKKAEEREKKEAKKDAQHGAALAQREVRALQAEEGGGSKRAGKDHRKEQAKEKRKEKGEECEHGIWKCRICNPVDSHKYNTRGNIVNEDTMEIDN